MFFSQRRQGNVSQALKSTVKRPLSSKSPSDNQSIETVHPEIKLSQTTWSCSAAYALQVSWLAFRYFFFFSFFRPFRDSPVFNLNVASVIWPNMQDARHAAVVVYRKCLATKQIRSNYAPAGLMIFSFEPCMLWWVVNLKKSSQPTNLITNLFKSKKHECNF